jgi:hypothetical protein
MIIVFLYLPLITLAQGQGNPPPNSNQQQPLTEVATDSTLTGNGKTTSPLGIKNGSVSTDKIATGAVTYTKLGTDNTPQPGQVLSFNGSGLSWQTPSASPLSNSLRVVDSTGAEIGLFDGAASLIRYMSDTDTWIKLVVHKTGLFVTPKELYFESTDCTGSYFMFLPNSANQEVSLVRTARVHEEKVYIPVGSRQLKRIRSSFSGSQCISIDSEQFVFSVVTIPVSEFGTPPFKLIR